MLREKLANSVNKLAAEKQAISLKYKLDAYRNAMTNAGRLTPFGVKGRVSPTPEHIAVMDKYNKIMARSLDPANKNYMAAIQEAKMLEDSIIRGTGANRPELGQLSYFLRGGSVPSWLGSMSPEAGAGLTTLIPNIAPAPSESFARVFRANGNRRVNPYKLKAMA